MPWKILFLIQCLAVATVVLASGDGVVQASEDVSSSQLAQRDANENKLRAEIEKLRAENGKLRAQIAESGSPEMENDAVSNLELQEGAGAQEGTSCSTPAATTCTGSANDVDHTKNCKKCVGLTQECFNHNVLKTKFVGSPTCPEWQITQSGMANVVVKCPCQYGSSDLKDVIKVIAGQIADIGVPVSEAQQVVVSNNPKKAKSLLARSVIAGIKMYMCWVEKCSAISSIGTEETALRQEHSDDTLTALMAEMHQMNSTSKAQVGNGWACG